MKGTASAQILILAFLCIIVAVTIVVEAGSANPLRIERHTAPPSIILSSPLNMTYTHDALLNVTVTKSETWLSDPIGFGYESSSGLAQKLISVDFLVDGKLWESIPADSVLATPFSYSTHLTNLTDGSHSLTVVANTKGVERDWIGSKVYYVAANASSANVHFTVETPSPSSSSIPDQERTSNSQENARTWQFVAILSALVGTFAIVAGLHFYVSKRKH